MKYIFLIVLFCAAFQCQAQKYILLDETISRPAVYTNHLTEMGKYKKIFPVEVKDISRFIHALKEIEKRLSEKENTSEVNNYTVGCSIFAGRVFQLAKGERINYIITSTCEGLKIKMRLCDATISNADNEYFIKAWIKYIKSNLKDNKKDTRH